MTKEEKDKLKAKLPPKWVKTITELTRFSAPYVRKIMSGKANHLLIEMAVVKLGEEYQGQLNDDIINCMN